jgi:NADH-quinone oxidoreductase subunit J
MLATLFALVSFHTIPVLGVALPDELTFAVAAAMVLLGAIGVVTSTNPVHAALMLVMTLFGVAVLFIEQEADFLAAVQIIVYAGAIVVLFLFVIMFLGVDRQEDIAAEPLRGQRVLAGALTVLGLVALLLLGAGSRWATGAPSVVGKARGQSGGDVAALGRAVFTTYLFPFEATAALLVIAVVGAVVLVRRSRDDATFSDEPDTAGTGEPEGPSPMGPPEHPVPETASTHLLEEVTP